MEWKIINILCQLKDAGLPEVRNITTIGAGWRTRIEATRFYLGLSPNGTKYYIQEYIFSVFAKGGESELLFDNLPSAIQKLQELLTDKVGGGNE